ncbi:sulfatase-like hydrolase/transferase [bacterium]|nr:sulfatase-like hydrolase/transferase [bacterium]
MSPKPNRPNILFVFSDQQRWDTMGCYGQKLDTTPNLDRLATEGVKFDLAFTCQPVCGPARACLQTGKYATELGTYRNDIALPLCEKTLAHYLGDSGYETAYVGKWHLASTGKQHDYREKAVPPERRGGYRDYWLASDVLEFTSDSQSGFLFDKDGQKVAFKGYRVDKVTDFALDFLENRDADRPFFMFLSYIEPHHQNNHNRYEGPEGSKERWGDYEIPGDLLHTEGDWRENYPDYLGCVNSIDRNFGRLYDELERQGIADDTVIVYTSDHGSHFRTRNGEYKRSCHDGCIHIPMLIKGGGFDGGKTIDSLVSLIDLPPTILQAAGVEVPEEMRGRALHQLLDGEPAEWENAVFLQISESQTGRAVRTRKWKYLVRAPEKSDRPAADVYMEDFLYDLEADPHEQVNLVSDPSLAEVREKLADLLRRRMAEAGEKEPVIEPTS